MRYREILEKFNRNRVLLEELEKEYADKKKGDAYQKRKFQLIKKQDALKKQAFNVGTQGNICHIHGKRSRPHKNNPKVMVTENYNLYFVNITEEEASALVKLHVKNSVYHTIRFIRPGVLITS